MHFIDVWSSVESSVPQRSVLGSLLLIIFINDNSGSAINTCKLKLTFIIKKNFDADLVQQLF